MAAFFQPELFDDYLFNVFALLSTKKVYIVKLLQIEGKRSERRESFKREHKTTTTKQARKISYRKRRDLPAVQKT